MASASEIIAAIQKQVEYVQSLPSDQIETLMFVDRWRVQMRAVGNFSDAQVSELFRLTAEQATHSLISTSEFVHDVFGRLYLMATRGDTFDQIVDWLNAVHSELKYEYFAELAGTRIYPGGPGAKLSKQP